MGVKTGDDGGGAIFKAEDLKLITKEEGMKTEYKYLKDVSAHSIYNLGDINCNEFAEHFISFLQYAQPKRLDSTVNSATVITWARRDHVRIEWLIEKGYFEKAKSNYQQWLDEIPLGRSEDEMRAWAKRMPKEGG